MFSWLAGFLALAVFALGLAAGFAADLAGALFCSGFAATAGMARAPETSAAIAHPTSRRCDWLRLKSMPSVPRGRPEPHPKILTLDRRPANIRAAPRPIAVFEPNPV